MHTVVEAAPRYGIHKMHLSSHHTLQVFGRDEGALERHRAKFGSRIELAPAASLQRHDCIVESGIFREVVRVLQDDGAVTVELANGESLTAPADAEIEVRRIPRSVQG